MPRRTLSNLTTSAVPEHPRRLRVEKREPISRGLSGHPFAHLSYSSWKSHLVSRHDSITDS